MIKADMTTKKVVLILLWVVFPIGLIWWLLDNSVKKDKFVIYHVKQWIVAMIGLIIYGILAYVLSIVTWHVFDKIAWIGYLLGVVWFIQAIIFILQHKEKELWFVGQFAKKLKF